jgi:hypothetical protein
MNQQQIIEAHIIALQGLYKRIAEIAKSMGGKATEGIAPLRLTVNVASPRSENVPALNVEMPDSFHVEFVPRNPLVNALSVQARRTHHGAGKNDWPFNFVQDIWRMGQNPLSDDEIRRCLTPEGPRPALY